MPIEANVTVEPDTVQTNIVVFKLRTIKAAGLTARLKDRGILMSAVGPNAVRLVTHNDADRAACEQAAQALKEELAAVRDAVTVA